MAIIEKDRAFSLSVVPVPSTSRSSHRRTRGAPSLRGRRGRRPPRGRGRSRFSHRGRRDSDRGKTPAPSSSSHKDRRTYDCKGRTENEGALDLLDKVFVPRALCLDPLVRREADDLSSSLAHNKAEDAHFRALTTFLALPCPLRPKIIVKTSRVTITSCKGMQGFPLKPRRTMDGKKSNAGDVRHDDGRAIRSSKNVRSSLSVVLPSVAQRKGPPLRLRT